MGELSRLEREATSLEREKEKTIKVNATIDEALRVSTYVSSTILVTILR